jgi:predicted transcriptional regulator
MDFKTLARLGALLAKDYAEDMFALLVSYKDISASEAASRLNLHIRTAQDYLETLAELGYLDRQEVYEHKRPYYRYTLATQQITLTLDLTKTFAPQPETVLKQRIREKSNNGARFSVGRSEQAISHVAIWSGEGRDRKERKISLTAPQGKFLFHLPFPNAEPLSISEIMHKAAVTVELAPEILDLVEVLDKHGVIERL